MYPWCFTNNLNFKMDSSERYSIHVSNTLDCMGYNIEMIKYRVLKYKELSDFFPEKKYGIRCLIVGSKGEGLSAPMKSDFDFMGVIKSVTCDAYPNQRDTVFKMDTCDSPPGYTKLKLINVIEDDLILKSLVRFGYRGLYISSEIFLKYNALPDMIEVAEIIANNVMRLNASSIGISGPARTRIEYINGIKVNSDVVSSFPSRHSSLLESWKNRHRDNNWPPLELVMNIQNTDIGYVVPVAPKGNDNQHLEWRICFTTIEQKLIHSFNDTNTKVYVLLKMVAKEIIQPIFEDITSYVMKNVVLWMAELVPEEQFREQLLIDRLMQALHYLKHCVKTNCLPSYMIPERNLLARKLTYPQRTKLADTLNEIISYGGTVLLRCEQFKLNTISMYTAPYQSLSFAFKRELIEKLYTFEFQVLMSLCLEGILTERYTNLTQMLDIMCNNQLYCAIDKMLLDLVVPEWKILIAQGIDFNTVKYYFNKQCKYYLS